MVGGMYIGLCVNKKDFGWIYLLFLVSVVVVYILN